MQPSDGREDDESKALLDTLLDSAPVGISFIGRDLRYLRMNPVMAKINGVGDPAAAIGRSIYEVLPDIAPRIEGYCRQVLETGEPVTGLEVSGETAAAPGVRRHFLINYYPIRPHGGEIIGFGSAVLEITEQKRLQEELRRRFEELAAADRSKDEFLAMLAHELRNPLAAIANAGQALSGTCQDGRAADLTGIIHRQVRHLTRLVDDLLDVSRVTRGTIELRKGPVELHAVIQEAAETVRPAATARRHTLLVSLPGEPLWLHADATRLEQVVANLLHNAVKFTDPGGTIRLEAAHDGREAVVRVRDDGAGIPAELLPRVFDLFVQDDRSLARSHGGLGIGLTLVRSLVELHEGTVEAFSDGPGRGSEFLVRLPLRPAPAQAEAAMDRTSPSPGEAPARILLVEDNRDGAAALAELLRLWGHAVEVVHDGATALAAAGSHRPEVVLLDIGLPGMDGYEVAEALRTLPDLPQPLLIALTGYGQEADRRRASLAGFDHHLVKPVDLQLLRQLLAR